MRSIQTSTYSINIGDVADSLGAFLHGKDYSKIAILVDNNTQEYCLPLISEVVDNALIITIVPGELNKSLDTCEHIWSQMAAYQMDRHSLMINLGGGVIGDMGGFAASCYMRGIDFVQIPTTLLSQVDASIGGKLAIDFNRFKNLIGLFQNPQAVLIDTSFLTSLSTDLLRSGYAEMIKHGLIQDQHVWQRLTSSKDWKDLDWDTEIYNSVQIKKRVVEEDPREKGLRKILNFGHTIGHAIESISLDTTNPLLHGEAIALGMMVEAEMSLELSGLSQESTREIQSSLRTVYADLDINLCANTEDIIRLMYSDKKNKAGKIRFSLLKEIGSCTYDIEASEDLITECLHRTIASVAGA